MSKKSVPCPRCKKKTVFDKSNPYRPFCSERCQTIDLGQWAEEKYSVPAETQYDGVEQPASDPYSDEDT